ncbi:hypothetical protein BH23ACT3_BH23ACT3_05770 [soil metagenome]
MLVVVRAWLPDRPGALGQVASRIGAVRGDVLGIEILEVGGGRVIDELVVSIDDGGLVDLLIAEVGAVDGVSVEHVRPIEGDRVDPDLTALAVGAELAEAEPADRPAVLCSGTARVSDASWSVVARDGAIMEKQGDPPDLAWTLAFLDGSQHLSATLPGDQRVPSDLVWAHLMRSGISVAAGRSDRPVHERERVRVALLGRLADALID